VATDMLGYGIVTSKWKLWYYPISNEAALFNRYEDPHEHDNLYQLTCPIMPTFEATSSSITSSSSLSRMRLYLVQQQLMMALLRWRARQDDLIQVTMLYCALFRPIISLPLFFVVIIHLFIYSFLSLQLFLMINDM
jgi:hypothetical protein